MLSHLVADAGQSVPIIPVAAADRARWSAALDDTGRRWIAATGFTGAGAVCEAEVGVSEPSCGAAVSSAALAISGFRGSAGGFMPEAAAITSPAPAVTALAAPVATTLATGAKDKLA